MLEREYLRKVVLITGASRGLGARIARSFSKEGAKVVINYNQSRDQAKKVLKSLSGEGLMVKADLTNRVAVKRMVGRVIKKWKRIDILVNNAGLATNDAGWEDIPEKLWKKTVDVNLTGVFNCIKLILPIMVKQKSGKVVNLVSLSGIFPGRAIAPAYTASKAGVINLTQAFAMEAAPYVNVNAIVLGRVEKSKFRVDRRIPLHRLVSIEDVVGSIKFLTSKGSSYITGQNIVVDGGLSLRWII